MELWTTNLEQDEPASASLKSFCSQLNAKRADLFRLRGGDVEHVAGSSLDVPELEEELLEKLLLGTEPSWNKVCLMMPLRCGVTPSGLVRFEWSKNDRPEFDPAFLQAIIAATSPYALWLGKTRD